jgi:carbamoyl-phosphate synthase small subunit
MSERINVAAPALLALADGTVFHGSAIGANGYAVGEVVFNTAMTGYQEILTDPSYDQQLVTLTYPHIGNVGTNDLDCEAHRVFAAGLVIRDASLSVSNFRSQRDLGTYLREQNVVAIADIDTRRLTRILRDRGAQNGCIAAGPDISVDAALARAREFPGLLRLARRLMDAGRQPPPTGGGRPAVARRRIRLRRQAQHPAPAGRPRL